MKLLIFAIGNDRYGLRTDSIIRVLPMLALSRLAHAPDYVAGLMNYRSAQVPVIDLQMLICGIPCEARFDTRIIVVDYAGSDGAHHLLGLMAEQVDGIRGSDERTLVDAGVARAAAPYLGKITVDGAGIVQLIEVDQLLPEAVRAILFQPHGVPC